MQVFWIVLAVLFLVVEFATVALISLWFFLGATAALFASLLGVPLWLQVLIFAIVSVAFLLLVRPFLRRCVDPYKTGTNVDALPGKEAVVTEAINNLRGEGAVRVGGLTWSARSADGSEIPVDTVVTVQSVEGVKVIVTPVCS